jgi:hypothetical protein
MSTMEPDEGAQPDDQQADAPRWEGTEGTDAPRWEGAEGTDAPRWEGADADAAASDSDDPDSTVQ